jgi:hypothetical protein
MTLFLWFWLCGAVATWVGGRFYYLHMKDNPDKYGNIDRIDREVLVAITGYAGALFPLSFVIVTICAIAKLFGLLTQKLYDRFIKSN